MGEGTYDNYADEVQGQREGRIWCRWINCVGVWRGDDCKNAELPRSDFIGGVYRVVRKFLRAPCSRGEQSTPFSANIGANWFRNSIECSLPLERHYKDARSWSGHFWWSQFHFLRRFHFAVYKAPISAGCEDGIGTASPLDPGQNQHCKRSATLRLPQSPPLFLGRSNICMFRREVYSARLTSTFVLAKPHKLAECDANSAALCAKFT